MLDYPGTLGVAFFCALIVGRLMLVVSAFLSAVHDKKGSDMVQ
jgi:hypothetical protein